MAPKVYLPMLAELIANTIVPIPFLPERVEIA
jgi:hypothetical protein